jgi:hypothetical protein
MNNLADQSKSKALLKMGQATAVFSYFCRKALLAYCRLDNRDNRSDVLMDFVRRIETNTSAIRELVTVSIEQNNSSQYYKLPMGLLLRSCLMDSLQGLYISSLSVNAADEMITQFDQDYVRSLPSRYEVYSDRSRLKDLGDVILRLSYGLQIEDHFPRYVDYSSVYDGYFQIKKPSKAQTIRAMYQDLQQQSCYKDLSRYLYAYFKTYSQYEHFSLMGLGDSLVPFDEEQPIISKPYEYISEAALYIVKCAVCDDKQIMSYMSAIGRNIKTINGSQK